MTKETGAGPDPQRRELFSMALQDFDRCVAVVRKTVEPAKQNDFLVEFALAACIENLDNYKRVVAYIEQPKALRGLEDVMISRWSKRDPTRLLNFAEIFLDGSVKNAAFCSVIQIYCERGDHDTATKALERMPFSVERSGALRQLVRQFGPDRVSDAIRWTAKLGLQEDWLEAMSELRDNAMSAGRLDALENLAGAVNKPSLRNAIIKDIAILKAQREGSAATGAWLNALPKADQAAAAGGIISGIAATEPEAATRIALTLKNARERTNALFTIMNPAFRENPDNAAKWVLTLPSGAEQTELVRRLADGWYDMDSMALSDWVNKLERGPLRDEALDSMARKLIRSDRDAAYQVAQAIQDEKRRNAFFKAHQP